MALEDCCIGRGLSAIRHNSGAYSYSFYVMKSLEHIFNGFDGEGTIFGSINKTNFENIRTIVPDEKVIIRFERIVNTLDEKIFNNSIEIKTLIQIRDSILPKLMTGKIRVT
jgi:type I restriction enzyme, S subunit